jgi:hypothetical protein
MLAQKIDHGKQNFLIFDGFLKITYKEQLRSMFDQYLSLVLLVKVVL